MKRIFLPLAVAGLIVNAQFAAAQVKKAAPSTAAKMTAPANRL